MTSNDARDSSTKTTDFSARSARIRRTLKGATLVAGLGAAWAFAACGGDDTGTTNGMNVNGTSGSNAGSTGNGGSMSGTAGSGGGSAGTPIGGTGGMAGSGGGNGGSSGAAGALTGGGGQGGAAMGDGGMTACNKSPGKAVQFDGDMADLLLVDIGTDLPIARTSRTVEMWAWFSGPKAWRGEHSLMEYGKGQPCHVFGIDVQSWAANDAQLDPYGNGCGADNTFKLVPTVPEMGWLHLAWSYDGTANMFQFTVNGIKQTIPSPMAQAGFTTTQSEITIGAAAEFGTAGFDGKIDEFRVWNIARTEADIKRDMNVMLKGTEMGLVAYFHFDDAPANPAAANLMLADQTGKMRAFRMPNAAKPTWVASDIPGAFTCPP